MCGLLCLAFFTLHNAFEIYPYSGVCQDFLPFYCSYNTFYLSIHQLTDTWAVSNFSNKEDSHRRGSPYILERGPCFAG